MWFWVVQVALRGGFLVVQVVVGCSSGLGGSGGWRFEVV